MSPVPEPGTSKMPGVYTARMPESTSASTTAPGCRYCSQVVVVPLHKSSAAPSTMPQYTSSSVNNASRGQTDSLNQRSSGSPSPALRTSVIGEWPWQLTSPGMSRPPSWWTSVPGAGGTCQGSPTHEMTPSSISTAPGSQHRVVRVDGEDGVGLEPKGHGAATNRRSDRSRETRMAPVPPSTVTSTVPSGSRPPTSATAPGMKPPLVEQGQRTQVQLDLLADAEEAHPLALAHLGQRTGRDRRRRRV